MNLFKGCSFVSQLCNCDFSVMMHHSILLMIQLYINMNVSSMTTLAVKFNFDFRSMSTSMSILALFCHWAIQQIQNVVYLKW